MERLTERFGGFFSRLGNGRWRRFVIIAGIAAIALLFLSTVIPAGGAQQPQDSSAEDAARVERELEQRLTDIISQIDGVTSPQVMVTLDRTSERVFAEEVKSSSSGGFPEFGEQPGADRLQGRARKERDSSEGAGRCGGLRRRGEYAGAREGGEYRGAGAGYRRITGVCHELIRKEARS